MFNCGKGLEETFNSATYKNSSCCIGIKSFIKQSIGAIGLKFGVNFLLSSVYFVEVVSIHSSETHLSLLP